MYNSVQHKIVNIFIPQKANKLSVSYFYITFKEHFFTYKPKSCTQVLESSIIHIYLLSYAANSKIICLLWCWCYWRLDIHGHFNFQFEPIWHEGVFTPALTYMPNKLQDWQSSLSVHSGIYKRYFQIIIYIIMSCKICWITKIPR